jgi:ribulose-5-phosphate 4-epimerase/fuculose-1-phosphate aldolase
VNETGSVRFSCDQVRANISSFTGFEELNRIRRKLIDLGMVGIDANGIGFGNLSVRDGASLGFYITGSGTGGIADLTAADFSRVVSHDFSRNWLRCKGARIASSESLTHAAVYESDPDARAVIHVHDLKLWNALLKKKNVPATPHGIAYGTPEMAQAVQRLFQITDVKDRKIFVMTAHDGGLVTFGRTITGAFDTLSFQVLNTSTSHLMSDL